MTPRIIRQTILAELARSADYALLREQLLTQVNLRLRPQLTDDQLAAQLSALLDTGFVDFLPDEMDPDNAALRRWLIREKGLTALRK
jgi:hypothetical protein